MRSGICAKLTRIGDILSENDIYLKIQVNPAYKYENPLLTLQALPC